MKTSMHYHRRRGSFLVLLFLLGLLLASCQAAVPDSGDQGFPLVQAPLLPSPTLTATISPTVALTETATEPLAEVPSPLPDQLVVLHTNDNWGETEPCG